MSAPKGLVIHDASPDASASRGPTDDISHEIFEGSAAKLFESTQAPAAPPPERDERGGDEAASTTRAVAPVETRSVELPVDSAPASFWAGRANEAARMTKVFGQAAQSGDSALVEAALEGAQALFATIGRHESEAHGEPKQVQREALDAAVAAFVPVAGKALELLERSPGDATLRSTIGAAIAHAQKSSDLADLAKLADRLSAIEIPSEGE